MAPARLARHPEDAHRSVLVRILRVGALVLLAFEADVPLLECVGDVLEEDQAEDDVLVLGCIHRAPQGVGHAPEFGLIPGSRALGGGSSLSLGFLLSRSASCHSPRLHHSCCAHSTPLGLAAEHEDQPQVFDRRRLGSEVHLRQDRYPITGPLRSLHRTPGAAWSRCGGLRGSHE